MLKQINKCENCGNSTKCLRNKTYFMLLLCTYCRRILGYGENRRIPSGDTKLDRLVHEAIAKLEKK